jgi:FKBP-type peptidyl-prolyl cis-trans isomerase SlyD
MFIQAPCVVTLVWQLRDPQGNVIEDLKEPVEFLIGGDDLLPTIEDALMDQEAGFETDVHIEPAEAFGDYLPELVFFESRSIFPDGIAPGMQFEGPPACSVTPDLPEDAIYTVTEVYPDHVVLDGNHPLAGMALRMSVTVRSVREATAVEIEARGVSSPIMRVLPTMPPGPNLH